MEAVIIIVMVAVIIKLWKIAFGKEEHYYDCAVCENCYGGNQEGSLCSKCADGCYFERRMD